MSYRVIMVWAISYSAPPNIFSSDPRVMYEPKRAEVTIKAYGNCIIPITHGYSLACL